MRVKMSEAEIFLFRTQTVVYTLFFCLFFWCTDFWKYSTIHFCHSQLLIVIGHWRTFSRVEMRVCPSNTDALSIGIITYQLNRCLSALECMRLKLLMVVLLYCWLRLRYIWGVLQLRCTLCSLCFITVFCFFTRHTQFCIDQFHEKRQHP